MCIIFDVIIEIFYIYSIWIFEWTFSGSGLIDIQKDHIHQMASLQAEIAFLRREIERPPRHPQAPLPVFPGSSMAITHAALPLVSQSFRHLNTDVKSVFENAQNSLWVTVIVRMMKNDMVCMYLPILQDQSSKQHSLMGSHVTDLMAALSPAPYDPV